MFGIKKFFDNRKEIKQEAENRRLAEIEAKNESRKLIILQIQNNQLPVFEVAGLTLQRNEVVHWQQPCFEMAERVVKREYVGGSKGVSVRVMKGLSVSFGKQRGKFESETGVVQISTGDFIVTNKRLIYTSNKKSFSHHHEKIISITHFEDGIGVVTPTGTMRTIGYYKSENQPVIEAIIKAVQRNI